MVEFIFPDETNELMSRLERYGTNPVAIDLFLQQFGVQCVESFFSSLTKCPPLFTKDEVLAYLKEQQQKEARHEPLRPTNK